MSVQADIETALARATAAYKNVSAERDALKDANDRAAAAEAERDRLREALISLLEECEEYVQINHLRREDGSPATTPAMRHASAALKEAG